MPLPKVKVFSTSGSADLAESICAELRPKLPEKLQSNGRLTLSESGFQKFANGCILPHIDDVRDHCVVIIVSHASPIHDQIFEFFHLADAAINADAREIILAFPYYPYVRSDKKDQPRISVMSRFLADICNNLGIRKKLILDPHNDCVLQYFRPTANGISAVPLLTDFLQRKVLTPETREQSTIVFSDNGAATRYREIARILALPTAYIDKQRVNGISKPIGVIGDVSKSHCYLFDDEIMSGGTAMDDSDMLRSKGAESVTLCAIHAVLAHSKLKDHELIQKLERSSINKVVVTDSIPLGKKLAGSTKFEVISVAKLMAEAIKRTILGESLTQLYSMDKVSLYR